MADFALSDEQKQLRALAREFAAREVWPNAKRHDDSGEFPREILKKAWDLGLMNTNVPADYGGGGLALFDICLIAEEIAWGCAGIATAMEVNNLATAPVVIAGTQEQKKKWLSPLGAELRFCSYAVTEPDAGSDVAGIRTSARKVGGDYVLRGSKMWITGAGVANWFFVLAYTDPAAKYKGMSAFVVPADATGVVVGKKEDNLGQRASDTRAVTFEDVAVPAENRLGGEGDGWKIAMAAFDDSRPMISAGAVGLARRAMECALGYAHERTAFGVPIYQHQGISFLIADMACEIEAARLLVWKAALVHDGGERNTLSAAFAKRFAADTAMKVCADAVQVYGGYGYSREYPVEKLFRDAKVFQIYEGTSQIQRVIIARELMSQQR